MGDDCTRPSGPHPRETGKFTPRCCCEIRLMGGPCNRNTRQAPSSIRSAKLLPNRQQKQARQQSNPKHTPLHTR